MSSDREDEVAGAGDVPPPTHTSFISRWLPNFSSPDGTTAPLLPKFEPVETIEELFRGKTQDEIRKEMEEELANVKARIHMLDHWLTPQHKSWGYFMDQLTKYQGKKFDPDAEEEHEVETQPPCPYRCVNDCGSAFTMGFVGGGVWHGVKGWRNAPPGYGIMGMSTQIGVRASALGGNFAVWGGMFSVFDCAFQGLRQREDPLNAIMSGACTGGILAARAGPRAAAMNAAIGGVLLGVIEGLGFMLSKFGGSQAAQVAVAPPPPPPIAVGQTFEADKLPPPSKPTVNVSLASLHPRRSLTSRLESSEDAAAASALATKELLLEEDDGDITIDNKPRVSRQTLGKPVYTAAPEFSADDFSFDDEFDDQ